MWVRFWTEYAWSGMAWFWPEAETRVYRAPGWSAWHAIMHKRDEMRRRFPRYGRPLSPMGRRINDSRLDRIYGLHPEDARIGGFKCRNPRVLESKRANARKVR